MKRLTSVALIALALLLSAIPASADRAADARRRQAQVRNQRAAAAAKLNALKASDDELEKAVSTLNSQVRAQQASAAGARRAFAAAEEALQRAQAQLAETEARIGALHGAVVGRAVDAYVRPQGSILEDLTASKDLGEASRRQAMLQQVAAHDSGVIDELRAARQDQVALKASTEEARRVAAERKTEIERKLREVEAARAAKARLEDALDRRIKEVQGEIEGMAAQEAQLNALIRERSAARASRSSAPLIDSGGRVSGAGLIWPTSGRVTSEFGSRWGRLHAGIDIGAPTGTPIRAAKGGEVIFAGSMSGYGNAVIIDHGGGFTTLYGHQSRIAARDGQGVEKGQLIGYVGSTGRSTGPHLHFETRVNGSPQNPRRYLP